MCADCQQHGFGADALPSDEERIPTFKNAIFKQGFQRTIYEANLHEGYRHSWVVVTINSTPVVVETDENATSSFVRGGGFVFLMFKRNSGSDRIC